MVNGMGDEQDGGHAIGYVPINLPKPDAIGQHPRRKGEHGQHEAGNANGEECQTGAKR
ncbi:MAG: hypothetical protein ACUVX8_10845 [Candidatus Zipacnadales bacterium]